MALFNKPKTKKEELSDDEKAMIERMRDTKQKKENKEILDNENEESEIVDETTTPSNDIYTELNKLFTDNSVEEIIGIVEIYKNSILTQPNE